MNGAATSTPPAPARVPTARRAKPRLLVVGPLPPPIGGVETCTQAILESRAFDDFERFHCDITKHRPKATQGRFDAANFVWAARHLQRMRRDVAHVRPDVVYFPVAGNLSAVLRDLSLGWIGARAGARLVAHQHAGTIERVLARGGAIRSFVRAGFDRCDRVLVLGERWRTLLRDYGVRPPIHVVPSTLRREVWDQGAAVERPAAATGRVRVLFVGQYGRDKGTLELLDALALCRGRGLSLPTTLVGPPQRAGDEEAIAARIRARALEELVERPGPVLGPALLERYRDADLFVLPSHREGMPVVLHEAGAFGLPVIATPVGAIPELVRDGENGRLVPVGDAAALAEALEGLARDPGERHRLGAALRRDVGATYHPDRVCERIAGHLREVLVEARR